MSVWVYVNIPEGKSVFLWKACIYTRNKTKAQNDNQIEPDYFHIAVNCCRGKPGLVQDTDACFEVWIQVLN